MAYEENTRYLAEGHLDHRLVSMTVLYRPMGDCKSVYSRNPRNGNELIFFLLIFKVPLKSP